MNLNRNLSVITFLIITLTMQSQESGPFDEKILFGRYAEANTHLGSPSPDEQRIVFMGNSITEGWSGTQPKFWKAHPNYINRGVSGQTTSQMLLRFRADVIALQPKVVVILAGTNDIAGNTGITSTETIANNIFSMADLAQQHGIKVVISSILPVYDYPWKPGLQPAPKIISINALLKNYALANGHYYLDYHSVMKDDRDGLMAAYTYDEVHLTANGYAVMGRLLNQQLQKVLMD